MGGFSGNINAVDDTSTAIKGTVAPRNDALDVTLNDSADQNLLHQDVLAETHDMGTQTNGIAHPTVMESELQSNLDRQGKTDDTHVTRPKDNDDHEMGYLALTCYRPGQDNDLDLESLVIEQARQDVAPENDADMVQALNEENIRLKIQRDDLLTQRAVLEDELSSSFVEKFELENELSNAKETIEKGRAYCDRIECEWKRDIAKLEDMIRLVEAKTDNVLFVELLRQQKVLEGGNTWLAAEVQMRMEDNRFLACQRQAALDASEFKRYCQMSSEIQMLRRWLSNVQAQLAETGKAKTRLETELQQERLEHQQFRNACYQKQPEPKLPMSSRSYSAQQSAYAGGSMPHKPSKFTATYPPGLQTRVPSAEASPQFSSERKSEFDFRPDTFFETCAPSGSISQQYGTRSKSKFTFGDSPVSSSASIPTGTTTGPMSGTDFNFTFGRTVDHQSSISAHGNTTKAMGADQSTSAPVFGGWEMPLVEAENLQSVDECDLGDYEEHEEYMHHSRFPSGCSSLSGDPPAELKDEVDLSEGLQANAIADNTVGCDSTKVAGLYINPKAQNGARKPSASDFFDADSSEDEVEVNSSTEALASEKTTEENITEEMATEVKTTEKETAEEKTTEVNTTKGEVPMITAGADIAQQTHLEGGAAHSTPTAPKNMSKTARRNLLRKRAKARKRAEIGGGARGGEIP